MQLSSIKLQNFRCFGDTATTVEFDKLAVLIGANGAGKSSVLLALSRMFGVSAERRILKNDFHLPHGMKASDMTKTSLNLEVRIDLPELDDTMQVAWDEAAKKFAEIRTLEADTIKALKLHSWSQERIVLSLPKAFEKKLFYLRSPRNLEILQEPLKKQLGRSVQIEYLVNNGSASTVLEEKVIPPIFDQMVVSEVGETPYCRIRLEATWSPSLLADGEIEEEAIYWIKTPNEEVKDSDKHRMSGADRSLIQCIYVPAIREPSKQLRQVAGTIVNRLFRAVKWSDETKEELKEASVKMGKAFQKESAVGEIQGAIANTWKSLHEFPAFSEVSFRPVAGDINEVLKNLEVIFRPGEAGEEHSVDRLSDGLKSLFYLSLVSAVFQIEESIRNKAADDNLFEDDSLSLPILTIFGVEEIENHLSPHYSGRILKLLQTMAVSPTAQVVLTSQSPSILKRIDPENVRHFRFDSNTHLPAVTRIRLPEEDKGEVYKYVKEAVLAYPELYFSNLVILGEGDSEEIVIPRVMRAHHSDLDSQFISVVPLGGRHVNHFWRLLSDLGIPYLTLLDLDRERGGGGWGRIKYACEQLLEVGADREALLGEWTEEELGEQPDTDTEQLEEWLPVLEAHGVYFASPLDLDWSMINAFPEQYKTVGPGYGPRIPGAGAPLQTKIKEAIAHTLKENGGDGGTYATFPQEHFIWYSYLFLGKGKPASHILALNRLTDQQLLAQCPAVLKRLVDSTKKRLSEQAEAEPA